MRQHGTIAPAFWTRGTGKKLRRYKDGRILATWLMTGPAVEPCGVYHATVATMAEETGLTVDEATTALARLASPEFDGFAEYDPVDELVWVPNLAREQVAPRADVLRSLVPFTRHRFADAFRARYADAFKRTVASKPATKKAAAPAASVPLVLTSPARQPASRPAGERPGTRLQPDWMPGPHLVDQVHAMGVDAVACVPEFVDYWVAVPGHAGVKRDWDATFRNAVRRLIQYNRAPEWRPPAPPPSGTVARDEGPFVDLHADPRFAQFALALGTTGGGRG